MQGTDSKMKTNLAQKILIDNQFEYSHNSRAMASHNLKLQQSSNKVEMSQYQKQLCKSIIALNKINSKSSFKNKTSFQQIPVVS